jgi:hypothetical protein
MTSGRRDSRVARDGRSATAFRPAEGSVVCLAHRGRTMAPGAASAVGPLGALEANEERVEVVPEMNARHRAAGARSAWGSRIRRRIAQLGVGPGEASELLQRLLSAGTERHRDAALGRWDTGLAAQALDALETYAARKRVIARLTRLGCL